MFSRFHYLNHEQNKSAKIFILTVDNQLASLCSVLHFPHPFSDKIKKVHRLVTLPDYQGLGLGNILLNQVGKIYLKDKYRFTITTTSPSLIQSLVKQKEWKLIRTGRTGRTGMKSLDKSISGINRSTTSFEFVNL